MAKKPLEPSTPEVKATKKAPVKKAPVKKSVTKKVTEKPTKKPAEKATPVEVQQPKTVKPETKAPAKKIVAKPAKQVVAKKTKTVPAKASEEAATPATSAVEKPVKKTLANKKPVEKKAPVAEKKQKPEVKKAEAPEKAVAPAPAPVAEVADTEVKHVPTQKPFVRRESIRPVRMPQQPQLEKQEQPEYKPERFDNDTFAQPETVGGELIIGGKRKRRRRNKKGNGIEERMTPQEPQGPRQLDVKKIAKRAWKLFLAEVSEEGLALMDDHVAREASRRAFRCAELFTLEESRRKQAQKSFEQKNNAPTALQPNDEAKQEDAVEE